MPQKTLETINLEKRYGQKSVLKNISFALKGGDILSLIGPNGAGKSTLLNILATKSKPTSGKILFDGNHITDTVKSYQKNISYLSHKTFLYDELTAIENLMFFSRMYKVKNPLNESLKLLEKLGLISRKDDPLKLFSRGMQQKIAIARALIANPSILYLDEPYTGLDKKGENLLNAILLEEKKRGSIAILVTHDIAKAYELSSRIILINKGKIVISSLKKDITLSEIINNYNNIIE